MVHQRAHCFTGGEACEVKEAPRTYSPLSLSLSTPIVFFLLFQLNCTFLFFWPPTSNARSKIPLTPCPALAGGSHRAVKLIAGKTCALQSWNRAHSFTKTSTERHQNDQIFTHAERLLTLAALVLSYRAWTRWDNSRAIMEVYYPASLSTRHLIFLSKGQIGRAHV